MRKDWRVDRKVQHWVLAQVSRLRVVSKAREAPPMLALRLETMRVADLQAGNLQVAWLHLSSDSGGRHRLPASAE